MTLASTVRSLHMKFELNWPSGFWENYVLICWWDSNIGDFGWKVKVNLDLWNLWPVTRKGTSWVSYSEIHYFRFLNREFYDESKNINMLVGSWSFWVSKCPKKMGTALKRHKLSIDVIVTLHVHNKIQQTNTRYKILQKDVTVYVL